jgi:DNA-binding MarR family transcriptional regulator
MQIILDGYMEKIFIEPENYTSFAVLNYFRDHANEYILSGTAEEEITRLNPCMKGSTISRNIRKLYQKGYLTKIKQGVYTYIK